MNDRATTSFALMTIALIGIVVLVLTLPR